MPVRRYPFIHAGQTLTVDGGITASMSVPGRKILKNQNNLKHLTLKTFYKKRNLFSIFRLSF
jgi:hypothetical protein